MNSIFELTPKYRQKSFYGKAKVIINNGVQFLKSYDTIHCSIDEDGNVHRYSDWRSHTTAKHLKSFLGAESYKSYWNLELEVKPKVIVEL